MELAVVGCNHRIAALVLRERLMLAAGDPQTLISCLDRDSSSAAMLLTTCNRIEIYAAAARQPGEVADVVMGTIASGAGLCSTELMGLTYRYAGDQAVEHLVRVSAGLESMVPGDPGILEQVRRSACQIQSTPGGEVAAGFLADVVNRACDEAGRIRRLTNRVESAGGLGSLAVLLARRKLSRWSQRTVAVIGAGTVGKTVVEHLAADRPGCLLLTNRSHRHGVRLARRFGATPLRFAQRAGLLTQADVIISCTGSPERVLPADPCSQQIIAGRGRPLLMFDLAVPRDIDPDFAAHDGVTLYNIDDMFYESIASVGKTQRLVGHPESDVASVAPASCR